MIFLEHNEEKFEGNFWISGNFNVYYKNGEVREYNLKDFPTIFYCLNINKIDLCQIAVFGSSSYDRPKFGYAI